MHLIQILLPLYDNEGRKLPRRLFDEARAELTERCGGLTAYVQAPATGLWEDDAGQVARDEIVIYEVMDGAPGRGWWRAYRAELARRFRQEELVVRATALELL
jgi:hypothetical protein